jgi:hypothetical protein
MDWDQLARQWRRVVDYVKSKVDADDESQDDDEPSLLDGDRPGRNGGIGFPPAPQPAWARIPRN